MKSALEQGFWQVGKTARTDGDKVLLKASPIRSRAGQISQALKQ
jgi:hypothetical protein